MLWLYRFIPAALSVAACSAERAPREHVTWSDVSDTMRRTASAIRDSSSGFGVSPEHTMQKLWAPAASAFFAAATIWSGGSRGYTAASVLYLDDWEQNAQSSEQAPD